MSFFIKLLRNLKIRFFSPNLNPGSYLNEVSFRNVAEMGKYWYEYATGGLLYCKHLSITPPQDCFWNLEILEIECQS